jgi:hypothetical protein
MAWRQASELAAWDGVYLTPNGGSREVLVTVTGIGDDGHSLDIYGVTGDREPVVVTIDADARVRTTD